jgi:LacI family transcriptional regulator
MRKIALCMELSDFYEHGIARGLVRYAKAAKDWRLYGYGWMFRSLTDLEAWDGEGIIARVEDPESADRLSSLGIPVVDVAGAYMRPRFRSVTNDDFLTGYRAAVHLLDRGFRRFAFLGVSGTLWSEQRREGFEKALAQRLGSRDGAQSPGESARGPWKKTRVPGFERPLAWWEGRSSSSKAEDREKEDGLVDFLMKLPSPTALFACNDTTGLRATELAARLALAVPESLAILGVDNEDILCELASPSLSSIMLDCEAIGFKAGAVLDAILKGGPGREESGLPEFARITVPPREVAERDSTRVFACDDEVAARAATFIRAHAHEGIDVSDVLAVVPSSRRSLETRFRAALGRSLHEEIVRSKLARAKRLLGETDYTLDRVAEDSGFGALGRFHSAFKEAEGMSPGEWRKRKAPQ